MTGAVLKKNQLFDIILFDLNGKIIGISEKVSAIFYPDSKLIEGTYI